MNESGWTRTVHKLLPKEVYAWKVSDRFTSGIPDAYYSGNTGDLWIEYKYVHKFPKSVKPNLSALQLDWLNARHHEGRKVYVVIGSPAGAILVGHLSWDQSTPTTGNIISKQLLAEWITAQVTDKNSPHIPTLT